MPDIVRNGVGSSTPVCKFKMRIAPPRCAMNSLDVSPGACVTKIGALSPVATDCMPAIAPCDTRTLMKKNDADNKDAERRILQPIDRSTTLLLLLTQMNNSQNSL